MGIIVDFGDRLDDMLDELEETYDGRILSHQGKILRVMPVGQRREEEGRIWVFHGHVYITTIMGDEIYQCLIETVPVIGLPVPEHKWEETRETLDLLTAEIEEKITRRGFIIRRGRYQFSAEEPRIQDLNTAHRGIRQEPPIITLSGLDAEHPMDDTLLEKEAHDSVIELGRYPAQGDQGSVMDPWDQDYRPVAFQAA